jgi:hypothetical protein
MTLTEFLRDRYMEKLDAADCVYKATPDGWISCACREPSDVVQFAFERLDLVRWCETRQPEMGQSVLRILAAPFRSHPDYREDWHGRG